MKQYPDPEQYLNKHMGRAAKRHLKWINKLGIVPTPTLLKNIADREFESVKTSYIIETELIRRHNVKHIMRQHDKRLNHIRREGRSLSRKLCPPITLIFAAMAWYSFTHTTAEMGIIYIGAALTFIAIMVLSEIINRPR